MSTIEQQHQHLHEVHEHLRHASTSDSPHEIRERLRRAELALQRHEQDKNAQPAASSATESGKANR